MSADNWTICPRCNGRANKSAASAKKALQDSYGKVPQEEFLQRLQELENNAPSLGDTLREDYELGIIDGEFYVDYRASCGVANCGFRFKYTYREKVT